MAEAVDRTVGKALGIIVGTAACFAAFFVQLMTAVALTRPDAVSGSRAPGVALNVAFAAVAIGVGVGLGRALYRRLAR